jgi:uncharacterized protein YutE (UPF0331/DUF86 family)
MTSKGVIENKISYLQKQLEAIKEFQIHSLDELRQNAKILAGLKWELYVMSQAVIDLAEAVIAYRRFRKPTTMREAFDILAEQDVVPVEFMNRFSKMVGFRNALAHDYEDIKIEVLHDVLMHKLPEVEEFIGHIKRVAGI